MRRRPAPDVSGGNEAAYRARSYAALIGMLIFEVDAPTLGTVIERWARFIFASTVEPRALVATLRLYRERCPVISLVRACETLHLDIQEVLSDDELYKPVIPVNFPTIPVTDDEDDAWSAVA